MKKLSTYFNEAVISNGTQDQGQTENNQTHGMTPQQKNALKTAIQMATSSATSKNSGYAVVFNPKSQKYDILPLSKTINQNTPGVQCIIDPNK